MFIYSFRISVVAADARSVQWSKQTAETVARITGVPTHVRIRVGGPLEVLFTAEHASMDSLLASQGKMAADADYQARIAKAVSDGLFVPGSTETAIWVEP
jgi:hypothetical protein